MKTFTIGIPGGRIRKNVLNTLSKFLFITIMGDRHYWPSCGDQRYKIVIGSGRDLLVDLRMGLIDVCFTGLDWLAEETKTIITMDEASLCPKGELQDMLSPLSDPWRMIDGHRVYQREDFVMLKELGFNPVRVSFFTQPDVSMEKVESVFTIYPELAKQWLKKNGHNNTQVFSRAGKIEAYVTDTKTAGLDTVDSGSTLRAHKLEPRALVMNSSTCFITHRRTIADDTKFPLLQELWQSVRSN